MPAHRTSMRKLKEVLRLKWACGLSHRQIGRAVGISVGAISGYAALASAAGLDWTSIEPLSDDVIEQRLHPKSAMGQPAAGSKRIQPDFALIHRELRRKGVTLQLLWEEYVEAHAALRTYRYTQFCQLYKDWALTLKRSMRQQHRAGERLFADFAGHSVVTRLRFGAGVQQSLTTSELQFWETRNSSIMQRRLRRGMAGRSLETSVTKRKKTGFHEAGPLTILWTPEAGLGRCRKKE